MEPVILTAKSTKDTKNSLFRATALRSMRSGRGVAVYIAFITLILVVKYV